jgi:DMSO/TMAO reductase YedYZ molybdopterin-dependent catalytic subunit
MRNPFRPAFWRSPLRGPRLTALLGVALLVVMPLVALTGLLSNDAYNPSLGANSVGRHLGPLDFYLFSWPTSPPWLYALNQGAHVTLGLAAIPIVLAKLWSVIPRLFLWPPVRSPAHALERLSLALLVGSAVFELVTGVLDIQVFYPFGFFFTDAHYYGAWVFIAAFLAHIAIKLPGLGDALRTRRRVEAWLEPPHPLVAPAPSEATISRRGLLGAVAAGSALLALNGLGQSLGGPLRPLAFLAPRGQSRGSGPNDFQVNRTAAAAGIDRTAGWRLELRGGRAVELTRAQLLALRQHTHGLPIACVEGWSTTQRWSGVPLRELARIAGIPHAKQVLVESLEQNGVFGSATLSAGQIANPRSLLALRVNGADLSIDHGFPARVIVPAAPGVHCTKWVRRMTFA